MLGEAMLENKSISKILSIRNRVFIYLRQSDEPFLVRKKNSLYYCGGMNGVYQGWV
jgi:hypothetical protein